MTPGIAGLRGGSSGRPALLFRGRALLGAALVLTVLGYFLSLCLVERRGFWVVDNALKFLQTESILRSGGRDYSIPVAGRAIDPDLRLNPIPPPFSRLERGKLYLQYPPFFALVSTAPFRLLGRTGLYLLPCLGAGLALLGLARIAREWGSTGGEAGDAPYQRAAAAVLLVGLGTPIWFYSAVYWEHTPALALAVWGLRDHLRYLRDRRIRSLVRGAVLVALAVWFRDDLYLLSLVVLIVQVASAGWTQTSPAPSSGIRKRRAAILLIGGGATLAALLPLWIFQAWAIGRPFGFHAEANFGLTSGLVEHLRQRPRVLYNLFLAGHGSVPVSIALSAPLLLLWLVRWKVGEGAFRSALPAAGLYAALGSLVTLASFFGAKGPIRALDESNSLFPGTPLLAFGLLAPAWSRPDGPAASSGVWLRRVIAGYALGYLLAAPEVSSRGIHWGCRFLLLLYPLLGLLSALNLREWGRIVLAPRPTGGPSVARGAGSGPSRRVALLAAVAFTLLVSSAAQCLSIGLLVRMTRFSHRLDAAVAGQPHAVILTSAFWIPACLPSSFFEKKILLARSAEEYDAFVRRLAASGQRRFLYLTAGPEEIPSRPVVAEDDGLRFFSVRGYEVAIEAAR